MVGKIEIDGENVVFTLLGVDKVLALKSKLVVPIKHIRSVSTEKADWNTFKMVRVAGSGLLGVVKDGTFASPDGLLFYEMRDPDKCITVELENEDYRKVVFEVKNKEAAADTIREAMES